MGLVFDSLGQYEKAIELYQQALASFKQTDNQKGIGSIYNNLGASYKNLNQYQQAVKYFQQSLTTSKKSGDRIASIIQLNNLGTSYDSLGEYPKALQYYQQSLKISQELGDRAGEAIILNNLGFTNYVIGQGDLAANYLLKSTFINDELRSDLNDQGKISLFEQQFSPYKLLSLIQQRQNKLAESLIVSERGRTRAFQDLFSKKQNLFPTSTPTFAQFQAIAKKNQSTIVEYSIIPKARENDPRSQGEILIYVISPDGKLTIRTQPLSKELDLNQLVTSNRENIINSNPELSSQKKDIHYEVLQELHKILIEPITDLLPSNPNSPVVFIPDGALFEVPFAALQDSQGKYLIDKNTVLTAPSLGVLAQTATLNPKGKKALIVGNPTMPKPRIAYQENQLTQLSNSEIEANKIAERYQTKAFTGSQANESTIKNQLSQYQIIHMATHGILNQKVVGESAIVLAAAGKDDGYLTVNEIFDLKLNADLVVLSACDTGRGKITGDGVLGLSRSLMTAGTRSLIVSLWAVNDQSTSELMQEFYRQWQGKNNKAQALRTAMLATKQKYPDPYYWAAMTLMGESN